MRAASEKSANRRPRANESRVRRNEPRGVATESNPSTPPCPANARAVRDPIRRKSMRYEKDSSRGTSRRARIRLAAKDRKSTRLNSSHANISYAVFCLKKKIESDHSSVHTHDTPELSVVPIAAHAV